MEKVFQTVCYEVSNNSVDYSTHTTLVVPVVKILIVKELNSLSSAVTKYIFHIERSLSDIQERTFVVFR